MAKKNKYKLWVMYHKGDVFKSNVVFYETGKNYRDAFYNNLRPKLEAKGYRNTDILKYQKIHE